MRKDVSAVGTAVAAVFASVFASVLVPAAASSAVRSSAGNHAIIESVACSADGSCAATGESLTASFHGHAFVLTGKNGRWGKAVGVPGLAALKPQDTHMDSVSCAPAGGCVAGGDFLDASLNYHVFVTSERNGRWSRLTQVFTGKFAASGVTLSCPAAGSCAAGSGKPPFAVTEARGRWSRAIRLRSPGAASADRAVVSCASAGNCTAGWGKFVASERSGRWGKPVAVPGLTALGSGTITSIACPAAAGCVGGGTYQRNGGNDGTSEAFVVSEQRGRWGKAIEVPGFTALNAEGDGGIGSISCGSAGNCVAGGSYAAPADFQGGSLQAFVVSERNGRWSKAIEVPGIPASSTSICEPDDDACVAGQTLSVSCPHAGACLAGGWYDTPAIDGQAAFAASYRNGHWAKLIQIPGLESLDTANASRVNSVSCPSAGTCAIGGTYSVAESFIGPAFLAFEKNGTWGRAQMVRF